jgi:hypothetical protein
MMKNRLTDLAKDMLASSFTPKSDKVVPILDTSMETALAKIGSDVLYSFDTFLTEIDSLPVKDEDKQQFLDGLLAILESHLSDQSVIRCIRRSVTEAREKQPCEEA